MFTLLAVETPFIPRKLVAVRDVSFFTCHGEVSIAAVEVAELSCCQIIGPTPMFHSIVPGSKREICLIHILLGRFLRDTKRNSSREFLLPIYE